MRFIKRILTLAIVFALAAAPVQASASGAQQHADYTKAMLCLIPQTDTGMYLSNLSTAEQLFQQMGGYENSAALTIYARGMYGLFSGWFSEAQTSFESIAGDSEIKTALAEWNLPDPESLMKYAAAANIEVSGGILMEAAALYAQIPQLFDAQYRLGCVQQRMATVGYPTSIVIMPNALTLNVGEQQQLSMQYMPSDANAEGMQWFSANDAVASVDADGIVTAHSEGSTLINYGLNGNSTLYASCTITVKQPVATSLSLPQSQLTLTIGESYQLLPSAEPSNAVLTWNTNDPSIVSVENGTLHALREGFTNVIVTSGSLTCVCSVTVQPAYKSINEFYGNYGVNRSSAYTNKTTSRSVEAYCAIDNNTSTAWNTNGRWDGEWISLTVDDAQQYRVSSLGFYNGYIRKTSTWRNNPRIRDLDVYCDGQYITTLTLKDTMEYQVHNLPKPMIGSTFKFVIQSVYYGNQFSDCALTELDLLD